MKRVARKSYESMAASRLTLKKVVTELVQVEVNYCFSGIMSHVCVRVSL